MKENQDNLIVVKKSKLKSLFAKFIRISLNIYIKFVDITGLFWIRLISIKRFKPLFKNEYTLLFFNTILLAMLALFFGGVINQIFTYIAIINIFIVMLKALKLLDKVLSWEIK